MLIIGIDPDGADPSYRFRDAEFPTTHLTDDKTDDLPFEFGNKASNGISGVGELDLFSPKISSDLSQDLTIDFNNRIQIRNGQGSRFYPK